MCLLSRVFVSILLFLSSLFAFAQDSITCPKASEVRITQGWALTSEAGGIDWDGSLGKDGQPIGDLLSMDLAYAVWLDGYIVRCKYNNGQISNVAPLKGVCTPRGIIQNCQVEKCTVKCAASGPPQSS